MADTSSRAITNIELPGARLSLSRVQVTAGAVGIAAFTIAVLTLRGEPDGAVAAAMLLGAVAPVGLGVARLARDRSDRFALALVGTGAVWSLTTLASSDGSIAYSLGRLAVWVLEPLIVALTLAYPHGRLESRRDRHLVALIAAVAIVLYFPTALIAPFPTPTPWAHCGTSCPANAFQVADGSTASAVADALRLVRELATVLVFAAVAWSVALRARRAGPLLRASVDAVGFVATMRVVALSAYFIARVSDEGSTATAVTGWLVVLSLPVLTFAFALGFMARRLFVANALERLSSGPDARTTPHLRATLASSLLDPHLDVVYQTSQNGGWADEDGHHAPVPKATDGQAVTTVAAHGRVFAAVVHDDELAYETKLMNAASAYVLTAMENERLVTELRSSLRDLSDSRARIASAADEERRRIERDLHDGAQQHLVALRIKLELLASRLDEASPQDAAQLRLIEDEVETTLDEVRGFARGVYPPLLSDRGLKEALRAAARATPIPTTVDAPGIRRYPREIESAVYFACMEALQNATKHARGATWVRIALSANGRLRFTVRDDGAGFEPGRVGHRTGLAHMEDRVAAVGGELTIDSAPGRGTRVTGTVPLR